MEKEKIGYQSGYIYHQKKEPKELFKFLGNQINFSKYKECSVLDIGCASGDLLDYFSSFSNVSKITGIDFDKKLVELAQKRKIRNSSFKKGSAETFKLKEKFDVITMIGVLTIFDDYQPALKQMLAHLKEDGRAFVVGIFNDSDIDAKIQFRNNAYSKKWQSGYNLFSKQKVLKWLKSKKYKVIEHTHTMPFDIAKNDDPIRAWTVDLNGERYLMNGLNLIYNLKILEITKA